MLRSILLWFIAANVVQLVSGAHRSTLTSRSLAKRQSICPSSYQTPCLAPGTTATDLTPDDIQAINEAREAGSELLANSIRRLVKRQQATAVCCGLNNECRATDENIPFCYNPETTEMFFPDGSRRIERTGEVFSSSGERISGPTEDSDEENDDTPSSTATAGGGGSSTLAPGAGSLSTSRPPSSSTVAAVSATDTESPSTTSSSAASSSATASSQAVPASDSAGSPGVHGGLVQASLATMVMVLSHGALYIVLI